MLLCFADGSTRTCQHKVLHPHYTAPTGQNLPRSNAFALQMTSSSAGTLSRRCGGLCPGGAGSWHSTMSKLCRWHPGRLLQLCRKHPDGKHTTYQRNKKRYTNFERTISKVSKIITFERRKLFSFFKRLIFLLEIIFFHISKRKISLCIENQKFFKLI
jgi:hypothetical protein